MSASPPGADDPTAGPAIPAQPTTTRPDPTAGPVTPDQPDPVLVRRARYERLANLGQRIGYLLLGVSIVAFVTGFVLGFPQAAVTVTIVGLVGSCIFLPPAIVAGFAVNAAEREDRQAERRPGGPAGSGRGDTMR